jgi:hypothetical protein
MSKARRIYEPEALAVKADQGAPVSVGKLAVEAIREDWLVEDRWWTGRPLRRHYYELVLVDGRALTVFHDLQTGHWLRQAG